MSLLTLYFTLLLLLPTHAAVFYLDESFSGAADGSRQNPFTSLSNAFTVLGSGVFELVLLGYQVSIPEPISVPTESDYTLRPDPVADGDSYFPLVFQIGANITIYDSNLTLQDIQIIELDKNQPYEESTFYLFGGQLNFNRVLVSNINYPYIGYTLILTTGNKETGDTGLTITNCVFLDLVNVEIALLSSKLTLINTTFSNIQEIDGPLLFVYDNVIPELNTVISNITIQNANFEYLDVSSPTNFLSFYGCTMDVEISNMNVINTTLTNGGPFIEYISDFENSTAPTSFNLTNIVFENIVEIPQNVSATQSTGNGLIFDIFGTTNLRMTNVLVSNVRFKYAALLAYNPNTDNFEPQKILFPSATIENLTIQNSSNANLLFSILDTVKLDNIKLENNFLASFNLTFAQFALLNVTNGIVQNLQATNNSGPLVRFYQVLNQGFYNCTFNETTSSHKLATNYQNIISISRTNDSGSGLIEESKMTTIFDNVNINGWTAIHPLNISNESNDTYAIIILSEVGSVSITNSKWSNLMMGGLLSTAMVKLQIDNLVVDADPSISLEATPWHRMFQFVNIGQLSITNSVFSNNKNLNLFNLFNIPRDQLFYTIAVTQLNFDNITVISNQNDPYTPHYRYTSFFAISSPLKPVQMTFTNSIFKDNIDASGVILADESYQVNTTLTNNIFENNLAGQYGAAFTARDMQDEYSQIQISNNIFRNNTCLQKGGVFAFISTKHIITSNNNTYTGNSAGASGGVGYVLKSIVFYNETNGYYSGNSAKSYGGSWYFSVSQYEGVKTPIDFTDTTFTNSVAKQKGGAIYIVTGSLSLKSSTFNGNRALVAGGDIYLVALSTLHISGVLFNNSYAAQGPVLYAETIFDETIVIEDCQITDIPYVKANTALIQTNAGTFKVSNTAFNNISCSLFNLEGTTIELTDVSLTDINCSRSGSFCVLKGTFLNLTISYSQITNVVSNSDLILLDSHSNQVIIDNIEVSNVRTPEKLQNDDQLFALRVFLADDITVRYSAFTNLSDFSTIRAERSNLAVSNVGFSNSNNNSEIAQFLVLQTSNVTVQNSSFSNNGAPNEDVNGGAIQINGDGGDYSIQNSVFELNAANQGGAISVEGTVDNFAVEDVTFSNNTAITNGGGIYFNPTVITGSASIKDCAFNYNSAKQNGSIYLGNQNISIENCTFNGNEGDEGGS